MTFIDMNSIDFYQPSTKAGLFSNQRLTATNLGFSIASGQGNIATALGPSNESGRPYNFDLIEFVDMTAPTLKGSLNLDCKPAPELNSTKVDAGNTLYRLDTTGGHDCSDSQKDNNLSTLKELLLGIREMQESQWVGLSGDSVTGGSEENVDHAKKNGFNKAASSRSKQGKRKEKPIVLNDDCSENGDTQNTGRDSSGNSNSNASDDSVSEEQDIEQGLLSTSLTSVTNSEKARCSSLQKKNKHSSLSTPSPRCQALLLLAQDKEAWESSDEGWKDIKLDSSADNAKEDQRDDKETETDNKEEKPDGDSVKNNTSLPCFTNKRVLSTAAKKPPSKRSIKCCHFSSPLSSYEETEAWNKSDTTSYASHKSHYILPLGPTPSHLTGLKRGRSDHNTLDSTGGQSGRRLASRTAVIYEQQSWEGEIIHKRDVKQGRGRPRKEFLVEWKRSWVPTGRLTAPGLLESWKVKKAATPRRWANGTLYTMSKTAVQMSQGFPRLCCLKRFRPSSCILGQQLPWLCDSYVDRRLASCLTTLPVWRETHRAETNPLFRHLKSLPREFMK